jgi:hypothetical protein
MQKRFIITFFLVCISAAVSADTIIFKDGTRIDAHRVWEEYNEVKCEIAGVVIGYPMQDIKRIIRQRRNAFPRKLKPSEIAALARRQPGSCYDLGRRYGHCTTLILYGEDCPAQDDFPLPFWCRGRNDTENGILEGIGLANKTLNLPAAKAPPGSAANTPGCFELGKRYGKCASLSLYGEPCDPRDDIALPLDCRGKADTKSGIRAGVKAGYQAMGFPTK